MQCRWKISKIGDVRKVKPVEFGYPLPVGLLEGTLVKLVSFDHGYYTVIAPDGNEYEIHMMCVCHPEEFLLDGQWWSEDHPKIVAEFANRNTCKEWHDCIQQNRESSPRTRIAGPGCGFLRPGEEKP